MSDRLSSNAEVVIFRDGTYLTLKEVFESLDLTGYDLNVDLLDVHADKSTFHRFDKFNLKYNPCGQSRLREIFLKQDNLIQGRFLGELAKQVFSDLEASKYQMAEYRISIYGRKQSEWDQLASWIVNNELYRENVVWLIQLPRIIEQVQHLFLKERSQCLQTFQRILRVLRNSGMGQGLHSLQVLIAMRASSMSEHQVEPILNFESILVLSVWFLFDIITVLRSECDKAAVAKVLMYVLKHMRDRQGALSRF
ncbi:hypothetical protein RIF29_01931 [Crotalaria pallida]|uniref:AMP deaminase n=1 Tax=Crotalaria pallida TaxID=3830 RepID=A0AAN9P899_CROPI